MERKLEVIKETRKVHTCSYSGCRSRIPKGSSALALVHEEEVNGHKIKVISYFCNIECYNDLEISIMYSGGACLNC